MTTTATLNNTSFDLPETGDSDWGSEVTAFLVAVSQSVLQKSGGSFTLTADADFGANFGLKAAYYKSRAANPSSTGILRLGNTETVAWRNAANTADKALTVNASDNLEFDGVELSSTGVGAADTVLQTNAAGDGQEWAKIADANVDAAAAIAYSKLALTGSIVNADIGAAAAIAYSKLSLSDSIVNADINSAAAIAYSKLALTDSVVDADIATAAAITLSKLAALTASRALVSDGSGVISASSVTSTELGYLSGVTSAIQTQLDAKAADADLDTHTAATAAHGVTGDVVGTTDEQTLSAKTLTAPVIDVASLTEQASSPATPSSGTKKFYAKTDGKVYTLDSNGVEQEVGSGSGGGGSPNAISNPHGASDVSDYTATGTATVTRVASGGPLSPIIDTAIRLDAGAADDYVSYQFTMPEGFKQRLLPLRWTQAPESGAASSEWKVELYVNDASDYSGTYTEVNLTSDSSGDTLIPTSTGEVTGIAFTADDNDYYEIRWVRVTGTNHLDITDVTVSAGSVVTGAVVGPWQTWTPSNTQGLGTVSGVNLEWRQSGESLEFRGSFTAGTTTATEAQIELPNSLSVGGTSSSSEICGRLERDTTYSDAFPLVCTAGDTYLNIGRRTTSGATTVLSPANGSSVIVTGDRVSITGSVPITEWTGSGIQYQASAQMRSPQAAGFIAPFAGTTVPDGWLEADGTAVSRSTYAQLFARIGTTWGAGDGSTTFNLPDLRNRYLRGDGVNGDGNGGNEVDVGVYQADELKAHTHDLERTGTGTANTASGANAGRFVISTNDSGGQTTTFDAALSSAQAGSSGGTETRPKSYGVKYIIKAFDDSPHQLVGFGLATSEQAGLVKKNKWQKKFYNGTATTTATLITFSNLTAGRRYKAIAQVYSSSGVSRVDIKENSNTVARISVPATAGISSGVVEFEAAGTTATMDWNFGSVQGDGGAGKTWMILRELNSDEEETSEW